MPRGSSINIQKGNIAYFKHNTRQTPTTNSIFTTEHNITNCGAERAQKLFKKHLNKRIQAYTKRTGQKLQKKAITHLSVVVNLPLPPDNKITPEYKEELKKINRKVCKHLTNKFGVQIIQTSIHLDEGWLDENGNKHYNPHLHLEMVALDKEGKSVRKKLTKQALSKLQTDIATITGLQRGKGGRKRLNTYEYKQHAKMQHQVVKQVANNLIKKGNTIINKQNQTIKTLQNENNQLKKEIERLKLENTQLKAELAKMKDLKLLNNQLRAELKQLKAKREDYALLEDFVKTIKQELKEKNLNIDDLIHLFSQIELYLSGETDKLVENTAKYWINNNRENVLSIEYEFFEFDENQVNTEINKYYDELDNDYEITH